jgi:hypothetical protein
MADVQDTNKVTEEKPQQEEVKKDQNWAEMESDEEDQNEEIGV